MMRITTIQIIIDIVAIVLFLIGTILGVRIASWVALIWAAIALNSHVDLKRLTDK